MQKYPKMKIYVNKSPDKLFVMFTLPIFNKYMPIFEFLKFPRLVYWFPIGFWFPIKIGFWLETNWKPIQRQPCFQA